MRPPREVAPEWLDVLARHDPDAVRSRRDLRRLNAWMLQPAIMARLLRRLVSGAPPRRIVDLGGGDGTFMLRVAGRLARSWPGGEVVLVDRHDLVTPRTRRGFRALGWDVEVVTEDVFAFLRRPEAGGADAVTANLFLHHFPRGELIRLLGQAARLAPVLAACEPRRSRLALAGSRAVGTLGCNWVTRHDAVSSVRAGFRGAELSALWPAGRDWRLLERPAGLFTHCFGARHGA